MFTLRDKRGYPRKVPTRFTGGVTCLTSRNGQDEIISQTSCMVGSGLDFDIETKVSRCDSCRAQLPNLPKAPANPWL